MVKQMDQLSKEQREALANIILAYDLQIDQNQQSYVNDHDIELLRPLVKDRDFRHRNIFDRKD